jgi:hypothetical protein
MFNAELWTEDELRTHLTDTLDLGADLRSTRYLFRGQNRLYKSAVPFIARLSGDSVGQAYTILRQLVSHYRGQTDIDPQFRGIVAEDIEFVVALLQHYGFPSHFLDLTDNLEIALFFSALNHDQIVCSSISVLDTTDLPDTVLHVDHSSVLDARANPRWAQQCGHAICPVDWKNMGNVRDFDLYHFQGVTTYIFIPNSDRDIATQERQYLLPTGTIGQQLKFLVDGIGSQICNFTLPLLPLLNRFPF